MDTVSVLYILCGTVGKTDTGRGKVSQVTSKVRGCPNPWPCPTHLR